MRFARFLVAVGLASVAHAQSTAPSRREPDHGPAGYQLVFQDEFETPGLPETKGWSFATEGNAAGWGNNEKQFYTAGKTDNARVVDGRLIIEARQEHAAEAQDKQYTSARLVTRGKAAWTYGFFEVRAKLPCGRGTWPAIWLLPEDPTITWPKGGEVDIMEHVGFEPGMIHQSVHTSAFNFASGTQKTVGFPVRNVCSDFHRYQLLWTSQFLLMGVDDVPKFMFKKVKQGQNVWPFDKPMHLLLNIAVGGTWGGQQGIDRTVFPQRMEIDYVRVYQPKPADKVK